MRLIYNPTAGHGRASKHLRALEKEFSARALSVEVFPTSRPDHASELAREFALQGEQTVIAMGGDGTISEVINGLIDASSCRLGIIPTGTGNDLARTLRIPRNKPKLALEVILAGRTSAIDLGWSGKRAFMLMLGCGFPSMVAEEANRLRGVSGGPAFFLAVYKALHRMEAHEFRITLDDQTLEGPFTSILIQNTPYCGGGQLMAPEARIDDGFLDIVVVTKISRLDLMLNFPRVYWGGHLSHPAFSVYRSQRVGLESDRPLPLMLDGDIHGTLPVEITTLKKRVELIVPVE